MLQRGIAVALLLCAAAFPFVTADRGAETPSAPAVSPRDDGRGVKRDFEFRVVEAYFEDKEANAAATTPVVDPVGAFLRAIWSVLMNPADDAAGDREVGAAAGAEEAAAGAKAVLDAPGPRSGAEATAMIGPFVRSIGDLLGGFHAILMIPFRPGPALPPAPDEPADFQSIPPGYYFGPGKP